MQISSFLFDNLFISLGFRDECLHCRKLGDDCDGVHADSKMTETKTTLFWCCHYAENRINEVNGNHEKLLKKIERRYNKQIERHERGGKNYRWAWRR